MTDERILYRGNPSAVSILGSLIFSVLTFALICGGLFYFRERIPSTSVRYAIYLLPLVPLLVFLGKLATLKFLSYELTTERIKITRGLFSKRTDELELYRVKDTSLVEPFIYRMFSAGNIVVVTGDVSTPSLELKAVKNAKEIREQLRASIEECRTRKRTGIVELE